MNKGAYAVYRIHLQGLGDDDIRHALSIFRQLVPTGSPYLRVFPSQEQDGKKLHNGEVRVRFPVFWRGDADEAKYAKDMRDSLRINAGIEAVIDTAVWENRQTLWWSDERLPSFPESTI